MDADARIREFLIAHGGPFYELQRQLGLIREDALRSVPRAAVVVGLAWGVPLLLSLVQGNALGPIESRPFLLDLGVWARFLVAVGLFVLMERQVEDSLRTTLAQFARAPLIAPDSIGAAATAVTKALRQRDSRVAEATCLALGGVVSIYSFLGITNAATSSWAVEDSSVGGSPTLAAWWCLFVSSPIFWFLLLRGLWRHLVWSMLMRRMAALRLRLVSTHPDGIGGLGFVGRYPNAYATFIFAISCVLGAALAYELMEGQLPPGKYAFVMGGWLAIVLALFVFPLGAFYKPLSKLKADALHAFGAQATRYHRAVERKLLGRNVAAPEESEAAADQDVPDPTKQFDTTRKLSVFLVNRSALVPVSAAALLPLAAAGMTQLPYKELLSIVKRFLLL
jgi:hypothetical protein